MPRGGPSQTGCLLGVIAEKYNFTFPADRNNLFKHERLGDLNQRRLFRVQRCGLYWTQVFPSSETPSHGISCENLTYWIQAAKMCRANRPSAGWVAEALRGIDSVVALPEDWDGQGSPGGNLSIARAAAGLVRIVAERMTRTLPAPFVCPIPGGALQIEWSNNGKRLEIEFLDEQTVVYLKEQETEHGLRTETDEILLRDTEKILELLEWLASS
jgi:hypothetical protein